jgi:SAP domain
LNEKLIWINSDVEVFILSTEKKTRHMDSRESRMAPKLEKPSSLTVPLLRAELDKRGLATTGLKAELVTRLTEALEGRERGGDVDGDAEMVRVAALLNLLAFPPRFWSIDCLRPIHIDRFYALGLEPRKTRSSLETDVAPSESFDVSKKKKKKSPLSLFSPPQQRTTRPTPPPRLLRLPKPRQSPLLLAPSAAQQ